MDKMKKKQPLQDRSKQTVKTILEAAARILGRDGVTGLNTNRISEVAGVSVGSVYQFFRNKESILEELLTRALDQNLETMTEILEEAQAMDAGLRTLIERVVEGMFSNFEKRGLVMSTLLEQAPQLIGLKRLQKIDEKMIPKILGMMKEKGVKIRSRDPEMAIFIIMQAVRGVISVAFARRMTVAEKVRVKRELIDLCVFYLDETATSKSVRTP